MMRRPTVRVRFFHPFGAGTSFIWTQGSRRGLHSRAAPRLQAWPEFGSDSWIIVQPV